LEEARLAPLARAYWQTTAQYRIERLGSSGEDGAAKEVRP
jgi:hypothetical protein